MVKRTQIYMAQNGPVNREDEPVALSTNCKLQAGSWLSGILATEVMILYLACFENQGQQKL